MIVSKLIHTYSIEEFKTTNFLVNLPRLFFLLDDRFLDELLVGSATEPVFNTLKLHICIKVYFEFRNCVNN